MELLLNNKRLQVIRWISSGQTKSFQMTVPAGLLKHGWNDLLAYIEWSNSSYDKGHWVSLKLVASPLSTK